MSTLKDREYTLNVARQFLQSTSNNPLLSRGRFDEICRKSGRDASSFHGYFACAACDFLQKFQGDKLQKILCAAPHPEEAPTYPLKGPMKTAIRSLEPSKDWLLNGDGEMILRKLAAVTLVAAAYDLCYIKHHQNNTRPS